MPDSNPCMQCAAVNTYQSEISAPAHLKSNSRPEQKESLIKNKSLKQSFISSPIIITTGVKLE